MKDQTLVKRDYGYGPRRVVVRMPQPHAAVPAQPTIDIAEASPESVALSELMRKLWSRKLIIAGLALAGVSLGVLWCYLQTPVYRARTSVQLEGFNENYFLKDISPITPVLANASAQNYLQNQVRVLESDTLARAVAARLNADGVKRTAPLMERAIGYISRKPVTGPLPIRPKDVQNAMSVQTSLQSEVMEVRYDNPDPAVAANAANLVVDQFIQLNRAARAQDVEDTTEALSRQTAELRARLEKTNRALDEYARRSGLIFSNGQTTLGEDRMRQLEDAFTKAEADRVAKQSRYEAALASPVDTLPDSMVTGPLHQYQTQLETLKQQLAEARTLYTPAHYKVQRLESQIAELEAAIAKERNAVIARLKTEYDAAMATEKRLQSARSSQMGTVQEQTEKEVQYNVLKREADTTQKMYDAVLEKTREAAVASALGGTNLRIIDRALPPGLPYSPNVPLSCAIGFGLGTLGGIGLVLVGGRSGRLMQAGDAVLPDLPELGVIPSARDDIGLEVPRRKLLEFGAKNTGLELVTWNQDASLVAESFRATLASILFSTELGRSRSDPFRRSRVLVVTSAEPAEGKTTILSNLGIAFSETNRRVLLIDADMRRPRLHNIFDLCNDSGLSDLLQSAKTERGDSSHPSIRATKVPNLWVLPSGPGSDGFAKLLYSSALPELLAQFRKDFDLVLIDTPPMMLYSDARVIARMTDGAVVVVRANRTNREQLKVCHRILVDDQTPVLGTVLNDCRLDATQYKSYGSYYKPNADGGRTS